MTSIDFLNKVHKSLDSQEYNLSYSCLLYTSGLQVVGQLLILVLHRHGVRPVAVFVSNGDVGALLNEPAHHGEIVGAVSYTHLLFPFGGNRKIQETGAGADYPLCRLSGADPRTCGVFGTGKCPARELFGSDNQNKRFETVPVSAVKAIS